MQEIQPKSYKSKEIQDTVQEEKKIEPIVSGKVRTKKKGLAQKAIELIMPEDVTDIKTHLVEEVLVPCFKDTIIDMVHVLLRGEKSSGVSRSNKSGATKISYRDYYDRQNRREYNQVQARASYELLELIFDTRGEAVDVLKTMDDIIARYGLISVAEYYELSGVQHSYTDRKYGWKDIRNADTVSVRGGGFTIRMPRPLPLE